MDLFRKLRQMPRLKLRLSPISAETPVFIKAMELVVAGGGAVIIVGAALGWASLPPQLTDPKEWTYLLLLVALAGLIILGWGLLIAARQVWHWLSVASARQPLALRSPFVFRGHKPPNPETLSASTSSPPSDGEGSSSALSTVPRRAEGHGMAHDAGAATEVGDPALPTASHPPEPPDQPQGDDPVTERVFLPSSVTPQYLDSFFEGQTTAQGKSSVADYLGKWMKLEGVVSNVQVFDKSAVVTFYVPRVEISLLQIYVPLWFSEQWRERVRVLTLNQPISVIGRIESISRLEVELRECEIVDGAQ